MENINILFDFLFPIAAMKSFCQCNIIQAMKILDLHEQICDTEVILLAVSYTLLTIFFYYYYQITMNVE